MRQQRVHGRWLHACHWPVWALSCLLAAPAFAVDLSTVRADSLQGPGWRAEGLELELTLQDDLRIAAVLRASRIVLTAAQLELVAVALTCPDVVITRAALGCSDSVLVARGLPFDTPRLRASWHYQIGAAAGRLSLQPTAIAGGTLSADLGFDADGWRTKLEFRELGLSPLSLRLAPWLQLGVPPGIDGKLAGQLALAGSGQLNSARGRISLTGLGGGNDAGTLAAENFALDARVDFAADGNGSLSRIRFTRSAGQVYLHPVFVDFDANPVSGELAFDADTPQTGQAAFSFSQEGIGSVEGKATFAGGSLWPSQLEAEITEAKLPGTYTTWLQPFLIGTTADRLETIGTLQARLSFAGGELLTANATLTGVHADDVRDRFALYDLNGAINWHREQAMDSSLRWAGGYLYRIGIGAAALELRTGGGDVSLKSPVSIPVLDGELAVSRFGLRHADREVEALEFSATIEKIGMRALTRALRWPPFSGELNGRIPRMQYAGDAISVDGALAADVFGGQIAIENLRIAEPFGVLPQVRADVRLRSLDLAAITNAFSFGRMEGRLDGDFDKLRLLGLSPVAFDGRLYTPADDRSRHRISQRAIENISDLGGAGAAAILSRGLLRFFESFAYDEIGWSCRLRDEVCEMDGVAPAPGNGYYIVKGKGVPRINVIGYSRRVSWPKLVEKLRNLDADDATVSR